MNKILLSLLFLAFLFTLHSSRAFAVTDITNSWTTLQNLPYSIASHGLISGNNKLYILGGATTDDTSNILHTSQNADGSLSGWSLMGNLPSTRYWMALANKANSTYLIGGARFQGATIYVNTIYRSVTETDGTVSTSLLASTLPNNLALGAAAIAGDYIFYSGGFNNSGSSNKVYSALINSDGTLGSWTEVSSLPSVVMGHSMTEHNGNLYVLGGTNNSGIFYNQVYRASVNPDGTLTAWVPTSSFPHPIYRGSTIKVDNVILQIGGHDGENTLNKVYFSKINPDGTITPWELSVNTLPLGVGAGAASKVGDHIYLTGGFRDGSGYLNSVYATRLDTTSVLDLDIPLLKQTDPAWGSQVYDSANVWSPSSPGISSWGCAMTSAAMVFQFHGITKLPNGLPLDPATLNSWLKQQPDGYVGTGWVNWLALSRLSKQAKSQNPSFSFDALEYDRKFGNMSSVLETDIENNIPGILEVSGGPGGQHFVVGKGIEGDNILINDPYYDRENLGEYGNSFKSLSRFIPSNTDLSYIFLTAPEGITLSVKDKDGNIVGEGFLQEALDNDEGGGKNEPLFMYYISKPESGNYTIEVKSDSTKQYELKQYLYDTSGEVKIITAQGIVESKISDSFKLSYEKDTISSSKSSQEVTFGSFIKDLDLLYKQKKISNLGIYITLKKHAELAREFSSTGLKTSGKAMMNVVIKLLDSQKKKFVAEDAYQILKPQAERLLSSI